MKWQDIVKLSDEDLTAKGVAALGARRKMLKVFETIRQHCEDNVSHQKVQWTLPEDPSHNLLTICFLTGNPLLNQWKYDLIFRLVM